MKNNWSFLSIHNTSIKYFNGLKSKNNNNNTKYIFCESTHFNRLFTQLNIIINWYLFSSVFDLTNHINFTEIHHVEISSWSTDQRTKTWCTLIFLIAVIYIVQLYWQDICICSLQGSYTHVGICSRFSSFFLFLSSLTKKSLSRSRCLRVINNDNWKLLPKKNILASLLFFCSWTHI